MRAISSFSRDVGISARSCRALLAFRILVNMSAIGSVSIGSPAALRHAGHGPLVRQVAQADSAEPELAVDGAGAAAPVAARVLSHLVPRLARSLRDERLFRHVRFPFPRRRTGTRARREAPGPARP